MQSNIRDLYDIEENQKGFISAGQFAQVYACRRKKGNQQEPLCVKIIKKKIYTMSQSLKEIDILNEIKQLKCENLLHIDYISESQSQFEIVMERCDMDLEQEFNILRQKDMWYTEQDCLNIFTQIANGSRILYNKNIVHRDIKPANILVKIVNTDQNRYKRVYKIADFGFSKILDNFYEIDYQTQLGTPLYTSPQVFSAAPYSGKCDIYSLGILFYQLFFQGELPISLKTKADLMKFHKILQNKQFKFHPPKYSNAEQIVDLLQKMIVYSEDERMSFDQFFEHRVLKIKTSFNYSSSIFSKIEIDNCLNKVYQMQLQFYRKYLFYKSVSLKLAQSKQFEVQAAINCLTQLGIRQLRFCFGFIHMIISDIHPYFKEGNTQTLFEELRLCNMNINEHPQYQLLIKKIKQQYFNEKISVCNQINSLEKEWNSIKESHLIMSPFIDFLKLSKSTNIEQEQITDQLKLFLEQKLLNGFEVDIQQSILLESKFPIQNSSLINPDNIFKD